MLNTYDLDVLTERHNANNVDLFPNILNGINSKKWDPASWKNFPANQLPEYPDKHALEYYQKKLKASPPLVLASEIREFKNILKLVTDGKAILLQGGECAESFDNCQSNIIRDLSLTLFQMAQLISQATNLPVIKLGRIAGQYAKPRSQPSETCQGTTLPSYRGEIINGLDFSLKSREPDPQRMLKAYLYSAVTLNSLRSIDSTKFRDYQQNINIKVYPGETESPHYYRLLENIFNSKTSALNNEKNFTPLYISHEALLLPYEEAMTRRDSTDNNWYNCSAHMLWLGERTADLDHAHVEYLRGVENPIGIKCGPRMTSEKLIKLIETLNPNKESGKIILIIRMGKKEIEDRLPSLLDAIQQNSTPVIWMIDPMHGNTKSTTLGYKIRDFKDIYEETIKFIAILNKRDVFPGGLHLEMTGQEVTECTGGLQCINDNDVPHRYFSLCDPRLNRSQSLELAFLAANYWITKESLI